MRNRKLMRWFLMSVFIFLCSFPVTADTQSDFLDALSRGLNTRWSYNEQMADKEASMTEDEHREYFGKLAQLELTEVEPFYNKEFEDIIKNIKQNIGNKTKEQWLIFEAVMEK